MAPTKSAHACITCVVCANIFHSYRHRNSRQHLSLAATFLAPYVNRSAPYATVSQPYLCFSTPNYIVQLFA